MVIEGVYPPRLKNLFPGKENRPEDPQTERPIRAGKVRGASQQKPRETARKSKKPLEQVPMETNGLRYNPTQDSQIIEDKKHSQPITQKKPQDKHPDLGKVAEKRISRQSAISEHMNVLNVLD
jgi:hypothetical protein